MPEDPGVQMVQVTSALGIEIEVASVTEDNWELIAENGDIDFDGLGSLTAHSVSLDASANIEFNGSGGIVAGSASLEAGANINFNGSAGIVANSASLVAGGDITSGGSATNDVDTSGGSGVIHLEADGMGTVRQSGDACAGLGQFGGGRG